MTQQQSLKQLKLMMLLLGCVIVLLVGVIAFLAKPEEPMEVSSWVATTLMNGLDPATSFVWMGDTKCVNELDAGKHTYQRGSMTWSAPIPGEGDLHYLNHWDVELTIGSVKYNLRVADGTDGCDFVGSAILVNNQ